MRLPNRCPECGSKNLHYWKGYPGNRWEPPEPEQLYCEDCEWEATDVQDWIIYDEDEERYYRDED